MCTCTASIFYIHIHCICTIYLHIARLNWFECSCQHRKIWGLRNIPIAQHDCTLLQCVRIGILSGHGSLRFPTTVQAMCACSRTSHLAASYSGHKSCFAMNIRCSSRGRVQFVTYKPQGLRLWTNTVVNSVMTNSILLILTTSQLP